MARKHGKIMTYSEWFPSINSDNLLNMWSREGKSQIENIISSLSKCPWSPDVTYHKELATIRSQDHTMREILRGHMLI